MDPYLFALFALVALLVWSLRRAGAESRRRKKAWSAYYEASYVPARQRR